MKKLLAVLTSLALFMAVPDFAKAASVKAYPKTVTVSVYTGASSSIYLGGQYQLINNSTGQSAYLNYTTLSLKHDGTTVVATYNNGTSTQKSAAGFEIEELALPKKMALFTATTDMRTGAQDTYPISDTFAAGEAADIITNFTNSTTGELWYKVQFRSGSSLGWVNAKTVSVKDLANALNTSRVNSGTAYRGSYHVKPVSGAKIQLLNYLDMEDYLKGVVPREMPASWHKEALKAQAIAARSYASRDLVLYDSAKSQVYGGYSGEDPRSNTAIQETAGLVVKYNSSVVQTYFHSTSGGRTANAWDVWGSSKTTYPYLASVADQYEVSPYSNWTQSYTPATILPKFGFPSTATLYDITTETNAANGEVTGVTVKTSAGDKTVRGSENTIRNLFPLQSSAFYGSLYSSWFTLKATKTQPGVSVQTTSGVVGVADLKGQAVMTPTGEVTLSESTASVQTPTGIVTGSGGVAEVTGITLNGKGWGHRLGMSQYGAKGYAEHGWTAINIMQHYFPGTTVSK